MSSKKKLPAWLVTVFLSLLLVMFVIMALVPAEKHEQVRQNPRINVPVITAVEKTVEVKVVEPQVMEEPPTEPEAVMLEPLLPEEAAVVSVSPPKASYGIALVIDDAGYDIAALERLLALPVPMAIAVIPDAPFANAAAQLAHQAKQVVMLHLPMEPQSEKYRNKMTPSFLHERMSRDELRQSFQKSLQAVPYVEGVNNHMGSYLTERESPMQWVMEVCREQGLFFIDSKTSNKSVAADQASAVGVPWASRRIFLDHFLDEERMGRAWEQVRSCVSKKRRCIVIGHPHEETVSFLEKHLSAEDAAHIVPVASLLQGYPEKTLAEGDH